MGNSFVEMSIIGLGLALAHHYPVYRLINLNKDIQYCSGVRGYL